MDIDDLRFLIPYADVGVTKNRLPHWQQSGAVYFVTFRLADAVPMQLLSQWEEERETWLRLHPKPWSPLVEREFHRRFSGAMEQWLDAGHGSCVLRRSDCARVAGESLAFFDGERCAQIGWVVMPNHVHAVFVLHSHWTLDQLIHSWKRHSSRKINSLLGQSGTLWQRDYFDRLVRDENHLENCVLYIRKNPIRARLRPDEYLLFESPLAQAIK